MRPAPAIRVILPYHLRNLAQVGGEVALEVAAPVTLRAVLDALEARYPMLRGTIRDHVTASAGRSCVSLPAKKTCRTSRLTATAGSSRRGQRAAADHRRHRRRIAGQSYLLFESPPG